MVIYILFRKVNLKGMERYISQMDLYLLECFKKESRKENPIIF